MALLFVEKFTWLISAILLARLPRNMHTADFKRSFVASSVLRVIPDVVMSCVDAMVGARLGIFV